jgi:triosephosphate isomerase (TIM)
MRKKIVAGNWKMNTTLQEGVKLASEVETLVKQLNNQAIVICCTPFTHITEVKKVLKKVELGAQNCAADASGAFTGEVSAQMISSTGAKYVIIGHSERRSYYLEKDSVLNKKVKLALANNLTPIFCIGELLSEREASRHFDVVKSQLENGIFDLSESDFSKLIIAYEPVWAIGTGKTATSQQAQEMHKFIRETIGSKYGNNIADSTSILYGGSCNDKNAAELFANPDVDGGLIGGASLKPESFLGIIKAIL